MYKLVRFFKKWYVLFLFIALEAVAINYYTSSTSYTKAKALIISNRVTGTIDKGIAIVVDYFTLARDNRILADRLAETERLLAEYRSAETAPQVNEETAAKYVFTSARIISNTITRQENYFIINKGRNDNIEENMAVLSMNGSVAGYVQECSPRYAVCTSILNRDFKIGGKIKGKEYFGSVYWEGKDSRYVMLSDIPRHAIVEKGDTVLSAYSLRFPPESFIGVVENSRESADGAYLEIKVKLGVRMTAISDVMVVKFEDAEELEELAAEKFQDRPLPRN